MWRDLEREIAETASARVTGYERYRKAVNDENDRRARRSTGTPDFLIVRRPSLWDFSPGYNPYLVRAHAGRIAHSMTQRLRDGAWEPHRPAGFSVPKPGSHDGRKVTAFELADEVISRRVFLSLYRKNHARFSSHAYAYRPGLTPHDAIRHVQARLADEQRVFVAEYDFQKFFDNVSHEYVVNSLTEQGIIISPLERRILDAFLTAPLPYFSRAEQLKPGERRTDGLPQGTSVSLFAANLVATALDQALEALGVGFVRYADDTLIWSRSYERVVQAVHHLHAASDAIGSPVNVEKSWGVRILVPEGTRHIEMASTECVDFLGHTLGLRRISMKSTAVEKVKQRVRHLLFTNLLMEPLAGTQDPSRVAGSDRDYVTYLWQLRRYLYGSLSENQVRRFQHGAVPPMSFKGLMSFYPLVNDSTQLESLDKWIASTTWLALRKRARLLGGHTPPPPMWTLSRTALLAYQTVSGSTGGRVDLRMPSVRRISSLIQSAVDVHGLAVVTRGARLYLYEEDDEGTA